jgi:hypothetical protein
MSNIGMPYVNKKARSTPRYAAIFLTLFGWGAEWQMLAPGRIVGLLPSHFLQGPLMI